MNPHHTPSAILALDLVRDTHIQSDRRGEMCRASGYQHLSAIPFYPMISKTTAHNIRIDVLTHVRSFATPSHPSREQLNAAINELERIIEETPNDPETHDHNGA